MIQDLLRKALILFLLGSGSQGYATIINGFESGDISAWAVTWTGPTPAPLLTLTSNSGSPIHPSNFGVIRYSGTGANSGGVSTYPILTLDLPTASAANLTTGKILSLYHNGGSFNVVDTANTTIRLLDSVGNSRTFGFFFQAITPGTQAYAWKSALISTGYAANLGLSMTAMSKYAIVPNAQAWDLALFGAYDVMPSFDRLALDESPVDTAPLAPSTPLSIDWQQSCSKTHILLPTLGSAEGFHIYRAPANPPWDMNAPPTGWTSLAYTSATTGTYYDDISVSITAGSWWYIAMPYTRVAPKIANTALAEFLRCAEDPAVTQLNGAGGPHEERIGAYLLSAVSVTVGLAGAIDFQPNITTFGCASPMVIVGWDRPQFLSGCDPGVATYYLEQATNFGFTTGLSGVTVTGTVQSITLTSGTSPAVAASTTYYYRITVTDGIGRLAAGYGTNSVKSETTSNPSCVVPTPTPTPVPTTAPQPGLAYIYPNPFHPDQGECFKIGNIVAGDKMTIYDMNGDLVYDTVLPISQPCPGGLGNGWDGFNKNGQRVVTGVDFLVIKPVSGDVQTYRVAVIRD